MSPLQKTAFCLFPSLALRPPPAYSPPVGQSLTGSISREGRESAVTVLRLEQIRRDLVIAWSGLPPDDLELLQSLRHVIARRRGFHVAVDVQDAAIDADIEGVTSGIAALQDAVGSSGLLARVAQDRVVQAERLGELTIGLGIVDACREVGDVEPPDPLASETVRRGV